MIWIEDIWELFKIEKMRYYFPGPNMTWQEGANALMRFIIYLSLIIFVMGGNPMHLIVMPIIMAVVQYYLYKENMLEGLMYKIFNSRMDKNSGREGYGEMSANNDNNISNNLSNYRRIKNPMDDWNGEWKDGCKKGFNKDWDESPGNNCESGMDELGPIFDGETYQENGPRPDLPIDDKMMNEQEFKGQEITCKPSTKDNPFGNSLPYDTIEKQTLPVCPDEYKKDGNFAHNLYSNIDDLFDRNNSQRQYTTNPSSTRVNDQEAAMQFFYNCPYSTEN